MQPGVVYHVEAVPGQHRHECQEDRESHADDREYRRRNEAVVKVEWPAQAEGRIAHRGAAYLEQLSRTAIGFKPSSAADSNLHALLLQSLAWLSDARQQRLSWTYPRFVER